MERVLSLVGEANTALKRADHMVSVTYKVVHDVKLLMVIMEHVHKAVIKGMDAVLLYDMIYKRIPMLPVQFRDRLIDLLLYYFTHLAELSSKYPDRLALLDEVELRERFYEAISGALTSLNIETDNNFQKMLREENVRAQRYRSAHQYNLEEFQLSEADIVRKFSGVYPASW